MVEVIIGLLICGGIAAHYFSKENDSPMEQLVEEVLEMEGVTADFSAADKAKEAQVSPK